MSVSLTLDAVRSQVKTVTRRHVDTWQNLKAGDRLTLIEKGMGLPKGAKQVVVAEVEVVDVRVEPLHLVDEDEVEREGFGAMEPTEFVHFWLDSHGTFYFPSQTDFMAYKVRRIEWRYLPAAARARADEHKAGKG